MSDTSPPEVWLYRRNASHVTSHRVLHPLEKEAAIAAVPLFKRKRMRAELEERWRREEGAAAAETDEALDHLARATDSLGDRIRSLGALNVPEFHGTIDAEVERVDRARAQLESARAALLAGDFGSAGASSAQAGRELWATGGSLVTALDSALAKAGVRPEERDALEENLAARQAAKKDLASLQRAGAAAEELILAAARVHTLEAEGYELARVILGRDELGPGARAARTEDAVRWDEVVLPDRTRARLMQIADACVRSDLRAGSRAREAGVLLFGPPGTGKTTIARAMAARVGAAFHWASATELLAASGDSGKAVGELFDRACADRPCVLFVDEVDGFLRTRRERELAAARAVSRFRGELDRVDPGDGLLVVGATNRIDIVDPNATEGRLTPIEIGLPDRGGRHRLLQILCRDLELAPDVDLRALAAGTEGMSGEELTRLRTSAGAKALRRSSGVAHPEPVAASDFAAALDELRARSTLVQA